jgi:hypothetical protein
MCGTLLAGAAWGDAPGCEFIDVTDRHRQETATMVA